MKNFIFWGTISILLPSFKLVELIQKISDKSNGNLTFNDLRDDPLMIPLDFEKPFQWNSILKCESFNLKIFTSSSELYFQLNSHQIYSKTLKKRTLREDFEDGLLITVFNQLTCAKTFQETIYTSQFGAFRRVNWALRTIQKGKLVVLSTFGDISFLLEESNKKTLKELGSSSSDFYTYNATWIYIFYKGGKSLLDVIVPSDKRNRNLRPLSIHTTIGTHFQSSNNEDLALTSISNCPNWLNTDSWNVRRSFCEENDGYGKLCDCHNPLIFNGYESGYEIDIVNHIPIAIQTTYGRSRILIRLLETLVLPKNFRKELILISIDKYDELIAKIAYILGIKCLLASVKGSGTSRTLQNKKFLLFNQLQQFPEAKNFIVLEDDVIVSKDFYRFMQEVSPIFEMDPTVWCVSGFNSYFHSGTDPQKLYRGFAIPRWGWMMPRKIIEEILPKWPNPEWGLNWDYYLIIPPMKKGRICVMPEVLRSTHGPNTGVNVKSSLYVERYLYSRKLNTEMNVKLQPLESLVKSVYDEEILQELSEAFPLEFKNMENIIFKEKSYVIYLNISSDLLTYSSAIIHKYFDIWDHFVLQEFDVTQFHHFRSKIFVVKHPTIYSIFLPEFYTFFYPTDEEIDKFINEDAKSTKDLTRETDLLIRQNLIEYFRGL